ncbi:hypothetical protein HMPREF9306_01284 [Propionimicrobium lymphophilum ACS-093-V-SCH5]|uniref:Uncharacterized protein n=1 Tax=Propionimicrobium lymphophilum ACS-093-V-SCH5 TaxID=883161 RepID=S2W2L7_9ACTN|nr:hypothetical protein [Propionimicrobium lymphophilum]EPD32583.1 hypothetical protein HMPREF9306_01282 [Propionimicrobium lymphophilum ACS-093-V-SCH5]EPD32585.1 hypothetical protein HMPREF9306_01284 [Propionimicrobium lymphophilum ACS-093-V-SCH5]
MNSFNESNVRRDSIGRFTNRPGADTPPEASFESDAIEEVFEDSGYADWLSNVMACSDRDIDYDEIKEQLVTKNSDGDWECNPSRYDLAAINEKFDFQTYSTTKDAIDYAIAPAVEGGDVCERDEFDLYAIADEVVVNVAPPGSLNPSYAVIADENKFWLAVEKAAR